MPEIAPARPAATVLLLRDGTAGIEVFMVVRNREIEFAGGALVFPGGRVEADDHSIAGTEPLDGFRIAGIRETFEETGLILGRPAPSASVAGPWRAFRAVGALPDLAALNYVARAITPPSASISRTRCPVPMPPNDPPGFSPAWPGPG
jgi:8-oxo-dGTP pyrophosphatase MutT (NUDIX family)